MVEEQPKDREREKEKEEGPIVSDYCRYCEVETRGKKEENGDGGGPRG